MLLSFMCFARSHPQVPAVVSRRRVQEGGAEADGEAGPGGRVSGPTAVKILPLLIYIRCQITPELIVIADSIVVLLYNLLSSATPNLPELHYSFSLDHMFGVYL